MLGLLVSSVFRAWRARLLAWAGLWGWALFGVAGMVQAQDTVWRCGSTLTNQLPSDAVLQRQCIPMGLSSATTVPDTRSRPAAPGQGAATAAVGRERTGTVQVASEEQAQRDGQARALLLAEKQRLQLQWQSARQAGDTHQISLIEADLASIERELSRRP